MPSSSLSQPLEQLADAVQRFVRCEGLRLLCVEVDPRLRAAAVSVAMAAEHLADNRSPLVALDLPACEDVDASWEQATDTLRQVHESLRAAGAPLAPLAERPMRAQGSASLAAQLLQCLGTVRAPAQGLLYLWVPVPSVVDPMWLRRVGETVGNARLAAAKFIVLLPPSAEIEPWIATLEPASSMHHVCAVDEARATAELDAEIDAESRLGPGIGGAWPASARPPKRRWLAPRSPTPPPSIDAGTHESAAAAADAEAATAANDAEASSADLDARLRLHVKRAALASRRGDGPEAVGQQAAARDLCIAAARTREAVDMELVLGAYLVQLGQSALAVAAFTQAAARASAAGLWGLAAQGHLAAAATHDRTDAPTPALAAYRHAIAAAVEGHEVALVFRAYWEASRVALRLELDYDAVALLGDAFVYSESLAPDAMRGTRARDVIAELSRLLGRLRRFSEAREVERALQRLGAA